MLIQENLTLQEKLRILSDAAKYDAACTSSGVDRRGQSGMTGNSSACGLCHSFAADGRCISLLKILMTNECVFDCKYCLNRASNDVVRAAFSPEEICTLTMEFYRRNYIEGLFLSSGVMKSPNHTMEQMYQALWKLRREYRFAGYIHVKAIPGADPRLIEAVGMLTDRMSVNLELPTGDGLRSLAPHKTRKTILTPMRQIQNGIRQDREIPLLQEHTAGFLEEGKARASVTGAGIQKAAGEQQDELLSWKKENAQPLWSQRKPAARMHVSEIGRRFVPAGQSTQMIIGATPENDYQVLSVAEALYHRYELKRVFYSAYIPINEDPLLPALPGGPPLLREHRLYQADWLLRYYGFQASELLDESRPNFNVLLVPKCDWALRHMEQFPVEINRAPYELLVRVPGIGVRSAGRIVQARRSARLEFADLKKIGVVLKRAVYFITCSGKMEYSGKLTEDAITSCLTWGDRKANWEISHQDSFRQLSLFDDFHMNVLLSMEDRFSVVTGQM